MNMPTINIPNTIYGSMKMKQLTDYGKGKWIMPDIVEPVL